MGGKCSALFFFAFSFYFIMLALKSVEVGINICCCRIIRVYYMTTHYRLTACSLFVTHRMVVCYIFILVIHYAASVSILFTVIGCHLAPHGLYPLAENSLHIALKLNSLAFCSFISSMALVSSPSSISVLPSSANDQPYGICPALS